VQVPYTDPRTGEQRTAPLGVDPAFAYNPGQTYLENASALQRRSLAAAPTADARALVRQAARPGGQIERMLGAADDVLAAAELVPLAMRGRTPVMLGPDAVRAHRTEQAADPTAPRPFDAGQWTTQTQAALDAGVRLRGADGATVYLLEQPDRVVILEVETTTDATGASILRVRTLRILTPTQAAADPAAQPLLHRAAQARGGDSGA
jgi:hypothetical protein